MESCQDDQCLDSIPEIEGIRWGISSVAFTDIAEQPKASGSNF